MCEGGERWDKCNNWDEDGLPELCEDERVSTCWLTFLEHLALDPFVLTYQAFK